MPPNAPESRVPEPADLRRRLDFTEAELLAECEIHLHRTGGPGGQHRNKVSSAVRLVHRPSGITVTASERRSQHENKVNAIHRLREAIALYSRAPLPAPVVWPPNLRFRDGRLQVSAQNPVYATVLGLALDALVEHEGSLSGAAEALGVTGSSLVRFLAEHGKALTEANRIRGLAGLPPLRKPR